MKENQTKKKKLNKIVVGGLREAIRAHGPITKLLIGSAAKRITGTLISREGIEDDQDVETCGG